MSNNTSLSTTVSGQTEVCDPWYKQIGPNLELPIYYVSMPACIFLSFFGRVLCLVAFYKQSKKEPAYFYQVSLTIGELFALAADTGYNLVMICGWNLAGDALWCRLNYSYMWYKAHLTVPLINMTNMIKQLQAIFMAADRVVAVWKPVLYQSVQKKSFYAGSVIISVLVGVSASMFDCFRYYDPRVRADGLYGAPQNLDFMESTTAKALSGFRDVLRIGQLVVLVGLNVVMTHMFVKQKKQINALLGQSEEAKKQRKQAKVDNSLLLLTLSQCFFGSISSFTIVTYYFVLAAKPAFDACQAALWGPLLDIVVRICELLEFASVLMISKFFRRILFGELPCCKKIIAEPIHFA